VRIESPDGRPIAKLDGWHELAPPAAANHWREHRSAYELARAWTEGDGAERLMVLLGPHDAFAGVELEQAIAERKTWFDDIPGGPRNHDLPVVGRTPAGVIGIETKADETFDRDLADFVASARRRSAATRAPERLDRLTRALFGTTLAEDRSLAPLRYQLFSALAGTLAEAVDDCRAAFPSTSASSSCAVEMSACVAWRQRIRLHRVIARRPADW
jgi:hypothetical protein